MDAIGTVLFLGLVCCLLLALQWGGQVYTWGDSRIIGLFVGSAAMTVCFAAWQWRRGEVAIIPLRVLRKRSICMGALVLFFLGMSSLTVSDLIPFTNSPFLLSCAEDNCIVRILSPDILPVRPGSVDHSKWRSFHCSRALPDSRLGSDWCNCLTMGLLCMYQSIHPSIDIVISRRILTI